MEMNSYSRFSDRMQEVKCIINLIPTRPTSDNVNQIDALCRSAILLLCSHFEGFLQDLMSEFIEEFNNLEITFNALPVELYIQNKFPKENYCDQRKDVIRFVNEIKALQSSDSYIDLKKENFNKTESNPKPDMINKLFNVIGIDNVIDELNSSILNLECKTTYKPFFKVEEKKELKEKYGDIIDGIDKYIVKKRNIINKKNREVGFYNIINRLLECRNNIAHGNFDMRISIQELIEIKTSIEQLVQALSNVAETRLNEFKNIGVEEAAATIEKNK